MSSNIAASQTKTIDLGIPNSFKPSRTCFAYGSPAGNHDGPSSFRWNLDSTGKLSAYVYRTISSGSVYFTFIKNN